MEYIPLVFENVTYDMNPNDNMVINLTDPHKGLQMGYWEEDKDTIDFFHSDKEEEEIHENNKNK